jgi:hypothetical protein
VVFATALFHELVLFATRFREGRGRTNTHGSERELGSEGMLQVTTGAESAAQILHK